MFIENVQEFSGATSQKIFEDFRDLVIFLLYQLAPANQRCYRNILTRVKFRNKVGVAPLLEDIDVSKDWKLANVVVI